MADYKEFTGKTVEDAVTAACEEYVVPSIKLDYEVVDKGSTGFLGFNAKPAVIKARVKEEKPEAPKAEKKPEAPKAEKKPETPAAPKAEKKPEVKAEKKAEKQEAKENKREARKEEAPKKAEPKKEAKSAPKKEREESRRLPVDVDVDKVKADAETFLKDVFKAMDLDVSVKTEYFASDAELDVELSGPEMGVLIGKRGQTLDSLQYLVSLVVNKNVNGYIRVKVDTEDYRKRRKETLENLAKNLSYKVKRTRKPVSLEPMNPYERRIIHSALQGDKYVTTHSEGEEPYRRVVITYKRY